MEYAEALEAMQDGRARAIRLAAGLTLRAAGAEIGVTGQTVWRWEAVKRTPHPVIAKAYVDALLARMVEGS